MDAFASYFNIYIPHTRWYPHSEWTQKKRLQKIKTVKQQWILLLRRDFEQRWLIDCSWQKWTLSKFNLGLDHRSETNMFLDRYQWVLSTCAHHTSTARFVVTSSNQSQCRCWNVLARRFRVVSYWCNQLLKRRQKTTLKQYTIIENGKSTEVKT